MQDAREFLLSRGYDTRVEPSGTIFYRPDGRVIGDYVNRDIRLLPEADFKAVVGRATYGSRSFEPPYPSYRGLWYERPDGALFGYRNSTRSGWTVDLYRQPGGEPFRDSLRIHIKP